MQEEKIKLRLKAGRISHQRVSLNN